MDKKQDNYVFLTQAPVQKVVLKMAVPTIISLLVTNLYNMADTFFRRANQYSIHSRCGYCFFRYGNHSVYRIFFRPWFRQLYFQEIRC